MKVLAIELDPDHYRSLLVKNDRWYDGEKRLRLLLDGSEKRKLWKKPLQAVWDGKRLPEPDILSFGSGDMVLHKRSLELLGPDLEKYAELLPLTWDGGNGFLVNVLGLSDCLNEKSTTWECDVEDGTPLWIDRFAFRAGRIPKQRLFKITQHAFRLFCVDSENGFYAAVRRHRLSGVNFQEVWSR